MEGATKARNLKTHSLNRFAIVSGSLALVVSIFLLLYSKKNMEWMMFTLLILVPSTIAIPILILSFRDNTKDLFYRRFEEASTPLRTVVLALLILLASFQFFMFSGWVLSFIDGPKLPVAIHFLSYYHSIGLAYSIAMLYRLSRPKH